MIGVEVFMTGELLTGNPVKVIDEFTSDIVWLVGAQALANVHRILDNRIKQPTPYYETQIIEERMTASGVWVHDRGIVYGPWLEGISARNRGQFKGYHAMREGTRELGNQVVRVTQPAVDQLIRRLG